MANLLETYEMLQKEAAESGIVTERAEVIEKYATVANAALAEEYGAGNYTEDDVIKVACALIDEDVTHEENMDKIAEYTIAGQIMAKSFLSELEKIE